ncbi:tRNA threonylcarbamoyladenosine biosynthesis protein TsaE [Thermosulfuriphilus ammonigenes]|uniref:tRNA (adenosine(37)-N6)-threonylcarbamoyltransferase complex ATPase subunit type 1 TsaE n=1 Tax=Thermosulfuriphilus ammonigenes TaxID=1936021 RepID=UPI0017B64F31|nr:tRNA (adenosine(37)-N6)-threonylcarbamoyltransferase complex ATPase subunit type 1 TsaE [Thermosulfuriphilus ammonigenes]MBA2849827.1 tRNA threonylcarbamoyladenosine biosynthesis protein TsaE [Thermosulfuriphilus ammonigenes]
MEKITVVSQSPEETRSLARQIGEGLKGGEIVLLYGDLGVGKTVFVQGLAEGLGVPEDYYVVSPSFSLINEYPGRLRLVHVDLYRLEPAQVEDLGLEDYLEKDSVVAIEWAERLPSDLIPEEAILVRMQYLKEDQRRLEITLPPRQHTP